METMQTEKPKVVDPIVQIAQALVDDVRRRGEVAELLYGTEKTRFARMILQQDSEIELLNREMDMLVDRIRGVMRWLASVETRNRSESIHFERLAKALEELGLKS